MDDPVCVGSGGQTGTPPPTFPTSSPSNGTWIDPTPGLPPRLYKGSGRKPSSRSMRESPSRRKMLACTAG
jgi:hypothetical protein